MFPGHGRRLVQPVAPRPHLLCPLHLEVQVSPQRLRAADPGQRVQLCRQGQQQPGEYSSRHLWQVHTGGHSFDAIGDNDNGDNGWLRFHMKMFHHNDAYL